MPGELDLARISPQWGQNIQGRYFKGLLGQLAPCRYRYACPRQLPRNAYCDTVPRPFPGTFMDSV